MSNRAIISEAFNDINKGIKKGKRELNKFESLVEKISLEDQAESDLLRKAYRDISNGVKVNKLPEDEKAVLDKYGLDAWKYQGETAVADMQGHSLYDYGDNKPIGWSKKTRADKMNLADKARKLSDREYSRAVKNHRSWDKNFIDAERQYQNNKMSQPVNDMRYALYNRKSAQNNLDNLNKDRERLINNAETEFKTDIDKVAADYDRHMQWYQADVDKTEQGIQDLLNKHKAKIKEALDKRLSEADMSAEDRADTHTLWQIYNKMNDGRKHLTDDEKKVLDKLNLKYPYFDKDTPRNFETKNNSDKYGNGSRFTPRDLTYNSHGKYIKNWDNINLADKAKKLGTREYADKVNVHRKYNRTEPTFQDAERDIQNQEMRQDVSNMKSLLNDRKSNQRYKDHIDKEYTDDMAKITAKHDADLAKVGPWVKDAEEKNRNRLDKANKTINTLLNKKDKELVEDVNRRIVSSGLTGNINNDILDSVLGQMSDGMWENSTAMNKYWAPITIDNQNNFLIDSANSNMSWRYGNGYTSMSDDDVRKFFGNKIKRIAQQELHDNNINPFTNFNETNDMPLEYLSHEEPVTVADAYRAYRKLVRGK